MLPAVMVSVVTVHRKLIRVTVLPGVLPVGPILTRNLGKNTIAECILMAPVGSSGLVNTFVLWEINVFLAKKD